MTYPKLMIFAPCERIVIDSITNSLTLSFIYESIQPVPFNYDGAMPADMPIESAELFKQSKFLLPPLATITVWNRGEVSGHDDFEQMLTITAPDGRESIYSQPLQFRFDENLGHRVILMTHAMTGRIFGISVLSVKIRRVGDEEWHTATSYPLNVEEVPKVPDLPIQPSPEA